MHRLSVRAEVRRKYPADALGCGKGCRSKLDVFLPQNHRAPAERGNRMRNVGLHGLALGLRRHAPRLRQGLARLHLGQQTIEKERGVRAQAAQCEHYVDLESLGLEARVVSLLRIVIADPQQLHAGIDRRFQQLRAGDAVAEASAITPPAPTSQKRWRTS